MVAPNNSRPTRIGGGSRLQDVEFRVMASASRLIIVGGAASAARWAEERLRDLERRWSRFLPDSCVSRLNRAGGGAIRLDPDTLVLVETMQTAARLTAGRYDPTMLCEIVDAGYATSIDDRRRVSVRVDLPSIGLSVHDIALDRGTLTAHVPPGLGLDPGGIGKGLAGDLLVRELLDRGASGALVCIGGDLALAGEPPHRHDWEIAIGDPFDDEADLCRIGVSGGGVATSSTRSRRWRGRSGSRSSGRIRHHILDPATRQMATTDLASVTVVASSGWQAEALATAAILERSDSVAQLLASHAVDGLAVAGDGRRLAHGSIHVADRPVAS